MLNFPLPDSPRVKLLRLHNEPSDATICKRNFESDSSNRSPLGAILGKTGSNQPQHVVTAEDETGKKSVLSRRSETEAGAQRVGWPNGDPIRKKSLVFMKQSYNSIQ